MDSEKIIQDNYIPCPPTGEEWIDKARDHDYFQLNVSLAAQLGGVSSMAGCPTPLAQQTRDNAEQRYYRAQEIHPE